MKIIKTILLFVVAIGIIVANGLLLHRMRSANPSPEALPEIGITVVYSKDCEDCFDINTILDTIRKDSKVKVANDDTYDMNSRKGKKLIKENGITRVPFAIISGDVEKIFDVPSFLQNLGKQLEDGSLLMSNVSPPYLDIASGAVKGKFTAIYLTDKSCKECYDTQAHQQALDGLMMTPSEEESIDISEDYGKELIGLYNITKVPTLLLRGELELYPQLQQVWGTVGTVEKDGTYVFRDGLDKVGTYYDLEKNKLVEVGL